MASSFLLILPRNISNTKFTYVKSTQVVTEKLMLVKVQLTNSLLTVSQSPVKVVISYMFCWLQDMYYQVDIQGGPKNSKLSYFVHIFAKYWPIFTIFPPADSVGNLLLTGMHTTPTMLLHYLVKHKYPKINNIIQSLVVTSSVMGQFKDIPLLESLLINY